jgi:hypothetical protein
VFSKEIIILKSKYTPTRLSLVIASVFALNGCIEVEDDSNDELTAALLQQNQILAAQAEQVQQTNTVTVQGTIINAKDAAKVDNALVTVKTISTTFAQDIEVTDGIFTVNGLPANSALEIILSSPDNSFMTRVFYTNTGESTSGVAEKDFGKFHVSEGQEYNINVQDSLTNMPIAGLTFISNTNSGSGSTEDDFKHVSIFDETSGLYTITLPKYLDYNVIASLDADRDGQRDYEPENFNYVSGTNIFIRSYQIENLEPLRFFTPEDLVLDQIALRISLVNEAGDALNSATISVSDNNNDQVGTYEVESEQYTIDVIFDGYVTLEIPSFTEGGVNYSSSSVTLSESSSGGYSVSISGGVGNWRYDVLKGDTVELAIRPREITQPSTNLEVVLISKPSLSKTSTLSVFYSQPVELSSTSSVTLFYRDALTIVRGNDSDTDIVLAGTTTITAGRLVDVSASFSLNNTKLTVSPVNTLQSDSSYTYNVGAVSILESAVNVDLNDENNVTFTTPVVVTDTPFDINLLVLDNNNYTQAGQPIVVKNSADVDSNPSDSSRSVGLFLPKEANQLKTLILNKSSYLDDGNLRIEFRTYDLINNGNITASSVALISLAENENVETAIPSYSIYEGTTLPDSNKRYFYNGIEYLSDNTDSNTNSITFDYAYETKAGEIETGTITLPVQ